MSYRLAAVCLHAHAVLLVAQALPTYRLCRAFILRTCHACCTQGCPSSASDFFVKGGIAQWQKSQVLLYGNTKATLYVQAFWTCEQRGARAAALLHRLQWSCSVVWAVYLGLQLLCCDLVVWLLCCKN